MAVAKPARESSGTPVSVRIPDVLAGPIGYRTFDSGTMSGSMPRN
jgi:hypothetical protein